MYKPNRADDVEWITMVSHKNTNVRNALLKSVYFIISFKILWFSHFFRVFRNDKTKNTLTEVRKKVKIKKTTDNGRFIEFNKSYKKD